jgi:DNA-binding CsgD family transcriptional regulator
MQDPQSRQERIEGLEADELEVFRMLCEGEGAPAIAKRFFIAERTAYDRIATVYDKLGIGSLQRGARRVELGRFCEAAAEVPPFEVPGEPSSTPERESAPPSEGAIAAAKEDLGDAKFLVLRKEMALAPWRPKIRPAMTHPSSGVAGTSCLGFSWLSLAA